MSKCHTNFLLASALCRCSACFLGSKQTRYEATLLLGWRHWERHAARANREWSQGAANLGTEQWQAVLPREGALGDALKVRGERLGERVELHDRDGVFRRRVHVVAFK